MRIAIAQINPTLGDFEHNKHKILDYIQRAKDRKCSLVVFPEAALFGYHPFDLLERERIVKDQIKALKEIEKKIPRDITAVIGVISKNSSKKGRPYFNSAAVVYRGVKTQFFHKQLLPTGDVFDEARFIESGKTADNILKISGKKTLITICEDIWAWPDESGKSNYAENPLEKIKSKFDLVINLSASPYYSEKLKRREELVKKTAKHFRAPVVYANLVGAQDEIIYDGASFAVDKKGRKFMSCASFEEDINAFELESLHGGETAQKLSETEELRQALVLGIRDFSEKVGIKKVHLGLSGGIDSAIVACLAADALGPSQVTGIALPGPFSADISLSLAQGLAKNLGISLKEFSIKEIYETSKMSIDLHYDISEFSLTHENLQARIRGTILMAFSNSKGSLLLSTSNKSEFATGYTTLYGDMCGGLAPIGDLTKEQVYALADLYNSEKEIIPKEIITRAPSAELRPNQKDQDSLPEYSKLDKAVDRIVENCTGAKKSEEKWLLQALMKTEFKRWQAAPILKVSKHAFGRGRRYPIAHRARPV